MPIALRCQRCGKTYKVSEALIGTPVQCSRCRFIMVVPNADGSPAHPKSSSSQSPGVAPIQQALSAAAKMEQSASRAENPLILRRPWYKPWIKPRMGPDDPSDEATTGATRSRADWRLILIASLPLLAAALLLYFVVPWSRFSGNKPVIAQSSEQSAPSSPATDHGDADRTGPGPAAPKTAGSDAPVASAVNEKHPNSSTTSSSPATTSPVAISLPHWAATPAELADFGPYVAYNGFAIRGPKTGIHLSLVARGGLTWVGPEKNGITPFLLLNVSPPDELPADASASPSDRGYVNNLIVARQVSNGASAIPGGAPLLIQLYTTDSAGKHITIRIQCASDDSQTLGILRAAALTLRPATDDDTVLTASELPPAYDRAAHPQPWEPDEAVVPLLMTRKNATDYTIRPPQGLKNTAHGTWTGDGEKVKVDGVSAALPLLRIEIQPLAGAEYHSAREWAAAQWSQSGKDAEWGAIDKVIFACVKSTDTTTGSALMIEHYATVVGERFITITIANRPTSATPDALAALQAAVRTIRIKTHPLP